MARKGHASDAEEKPQSDLTQKRGQGHDPASGSDRIRQTGLRARQPRGCVARLQRIEPPTASWRWKRWRRRSAVDLVVSDVVMPK